MSGNGGSDRLAGLRTGFTGRITIQSAAAVVTDVTTVAAVGIGDANAVATNDGSRSSG